MSDSTIMKSNQSHPGRTAVTFTLSDARLRQITNMAGNGNMDMWLVDTCGGWASEYKPVQENIRPPSGSQSHWY
ncbi:hypothetical protein [Yersinia intermedia]|uniref:hypothetical protein n=1 Tax=Yersinia intermedia TaxID=631 RepID=UPI0011A5AD29|nr:hypothetical protein [Yersinia intermedia]